MKKSLIFLLICALALCCAAGCGEGKNGPDDTTVGGGTGTPSGAAAGNGILSDFTSAYLDGTPADSSVFRGHALTMVNVWATFCGPCIREMPELAELSKRYADRGFQIVGIPVDVTDDSTMAAALNIISQTGADYAHILPSESLGRALLNEVEYVPTTVFVNERGEQVGELHIGSMSGAEWEALILSLLEQVK